MAESKIIEKAIEARVNACFLPAKPLPAGKINDQFTEHMKEKADEKKENPEPTFADNINQFIGTPEQRVLFISREGEKLKATLTVPPVKKKVLYFLKNKQYSESPRAKTIFASEFLDGMITGELSESHLQTLQLIAQEVYFPLLSNPNNRGGWSGPTSKEVMLKFSTFLSTLTMTAGQSKGHTVLPQPPPEAFNDEDLPEKERMHLLETCVVSWTEKIQSSLSTSPESDQLPGVYPDPLVEVEFWDAKTKDLSRLYQQLTTDKMKQVLAVMTEMKSNMVDNFTNLANSVLAARNEAYQNHKFLMTMKVEFGKLRDESEMALLEETFYPLFHCMLLIWKHSTSYNTKPRLVCLIKEICNALILQGTKFCDSAKMFGQLEEGDSGPAMTNIRAAANMAKKFKDVFDRYVILSGEVPEEKWNIQKDEVFPRLDLFIERCGDILEFVQIYAEFQKLERICFGGTKGQSLTDLMLAIHKDFLRAVEEFKNIGYDMMDITKPSFDDDFYRFRSKVKDMERKLATVLSIGFDDCATITAQFKLLDTFEGMLLRPIIKDELDKKRSLLIQTYAADLAEVQGMFHKGKEAPRFDRWSCNMPPIAGKLLWCRGLLDRDVDPFESLIQLTSSLNVEDSKEIKKMHDSVTSQLRAYESQHLEAWTKDVDSISTEKLNMPLLRRDERRHLLVNFDEALVRLLREVKYYILLDIEVLPSALAVYAKAEQYRTQIANLELLVHMYNEMQDTLLDVEKPLIQSEISHIDEVVQKGISDLNWTSPSVNDFIAAVLVAVRTVYETVQKMKQNFNEIKSSITKYAAEPLVERHKNKSITPSEFEEKLASHQKTRHLEIEKIQIENHKLQLETLKVLNAKLNSPTWRAYIEFVQEAVRDGLALCIVNSVKFLCDNMEPLMIEKNKMPPLLEIQIRLFHVDVLFSAEEIPTNGTEDSKTIRKSRREVWQIVNDWVEGFFEIGNKMTRMDGSFYVGDLKKQEDIVRAITFLKMQSDANRKDCDAYRSEWASPTFDHLWKNDKKTEFAKFLAHSSNKPQESATNNDEDNEPRNTEEESNKHGDEDGEEEEDVVPLSAFEDKILFYKDLEAQVDARANIKEIGWLKINATQIKKDLKDLIQQWIFVYTEHLYNMVTRKLNQLESLMNEVKDGMQQEVGPGDSEGLKKVLAYIHQVRSKERSVNAMFDPIKDTVALLRKHGSKSLDEYETKLLNDAPVKWANTVVEVYKIKEKVNALQSEEMDKIKEKIDLFQIDLQNFRTEFTNHSPFIYKTPVDDAYARIYEFHKKINEKEAEALKLKSLEKIFDLGESKIVQLKKCREENKFLKQVWDMICFVRHQLDFWRRTLWDAIDVDSLTSATKAIVAQIKNMDSQVRSWNCYTGLAEEIKNFGTVLSMISQLHSQTMKERHWRQLKSETRKQFVKDHTFCLGNLLDLQLYKHTAVVDFIVDLANKENKIDAQLKKIQNYWGSSTLDFKTHKTHKEVQMISPSEEILQNLQEHMAALQSMSAQGAYVAFFIETVSFWSKALVDSDSNLTVWIEVQAKWASLEAIFLGSADIRQSLPEDTARFIKIDQDFKALMANACTTPNLVNCCRASGREEILRSMAKNLELCEKSLNAYLETKRRKFPRFYFLSNISLLDILSNGYDPRNVQKHLGDCFDNIVELVFREKKEVVGDYSRSAYIMKSKEGDEQVEFQNDFECKGAAEDWLGGLVEHMRETLKEYFSKAKFTADHWEIDKPRDKWLDDYCAQVSLACSQIVWTDEVESQFDSLADGNEQAMKDYMKQAMIGRLDVLIHMVLDLGLSFCKRVKIITLITIDVHNRDVVQKLIDQKIQDKKAFTWQSQMRYGWKPETKDCTVMIADTTFYYSYEYIGNTGRLVITPLTDRCYITLSQALNLTMGGAPAGPAGTGKTETTKDLGRALGLPVYVFNCSEQMGVVSLGLIFKGLSMTGSWGCFDEFNRIPVEVLSVVATQVNTILNAIKGHKVEFDFMGEIIPLFEKVGIFITMNPGYAGRTELPENLKTLFRSCAMVVPDFDLICENMLMSEGFNSAQRLAKKFTTLYSLSSELLSKQKHYDWGLRATKAVLRVAGGMKRADMKEQKALGKPVSAEDSVLMRALRDFNTPKLVADDMPIFVRLVADLFPEFKHVQRKYDLGLEKMAIELCPKLEENGVKKPLRPEPGFIRKVVELDELLGIRHSVFIVGPAGSAKSESWKTLMEVMALKNSDGTYGGNGDFKDFNNKVYHEVLNPKAVQNRELYGWLVKGDWNDGVLSNIMRNMSRNKQGFHNYNSNMKNKWIILDGDIDPEWIESLNTVMDDNKVLTLVSNERIPVTKQMRLIFEIADLKQATPATVSRAGIMYINPKDVGTRPFLESWISKRPGPPSKERSMLEAQSDRYVKPETFAEVDKFAKVAPISEMNMVKTMCFLLEGLLDQYSEWKKLQERQDKKVPDATDKELFESIFIYCCVWAFGGACPLKFKGVEIRKDFSTWWKAAFAQGTTVKFPIAPKDSTVFDFYVNFETGKFEPWIDKLPHYTAAFEPGNLKSVFVPTLDTLRLDFLCSLLVEKKRACLLVGEAGTGKTMFAKKFLKDKREQFTSCAINLNYFTDAKALQLMMENPLRRIMGTTLGPPGTKQMIYFIDDLNMPYVDKYGTQSPSAFVIHHMYYSAWYNTATLIAQKVINVQYMACMNPTAGSFLIHPRYQGQFCTLACPLPGKEVLEGIYGQLLGVHYKSFPPVMQETATTMVKCAMDILDNVKRVQNFIPTTMKFHYQFNLRELSNVFQGCCNVSSRSKFDKVKLLRLFRHEHLRVYADRLRYELDMQAFDKIVESCMRKEFKEVATEVLTGPNFVDEKDKKDEKKKDVMNELFFSYMTQGGQPVYSPVPSMQKLRVALERALAAYNDTFVAMDLELFDVAMEHVIRIVRIIEQPQGNALLVGVGGSGKQSLARLASSIVGCDVFQITVSQSYGVTDLKNDLQELYRKAGVKGIPLTFLLTDSQIVDEKWLVFINDILSSGYIPDLFSVEDYQAISESLRSEAKSLDIPDNKEAMFDFFMSKVKTNLHLVLCFSPVGDSFRKRCQKFPALISCTTIDWFHPWPQSALISVASRFLQETDLGQETFRDLVSKHMAECHMSVDTVSNIYRDVERRYNYTTPKSFLELISYFKSLLEVKRLILDAEANRRLTGIDMVNKTKLLVEDLVIKNQAVQVRASEKAEAAAELIKKMSIQQAIVKEQQDLAQIEKDKAELISERSFKVKNEATTALALAEPKKKKAEAALKGLTAASIDEVKRYSSMPGQSGMVSLAILITLGYKVKGKLSDMDNEAAKAADFGQLKTIIKTGKEFKERLENFKIEDPKVCKPELIPILDEFCAHPAFQQEFIPGETIIDPFTGETVPKPKELKDGSGRPELPFWNNSQAAANMAQWLINSVSYWHVYQMVSPLEAAAKAAGDEFEEASNKLQAVEAKVKGLQDQLAKLMEQLTKATNEKKAVEDELKAGQDKLNLAYRLVRGLEEQYNRWSKEVAGLEERKRCLVGDVCVSSAFVSYVGAFNQKYRNLLWREKWIPDLDTRKIPYTPGLDPLDVLAGESDKALWKNEGLASDRISLENGALCTQAKRWPLMIDPQLQGLKWMMSPARKYKNGLRVLQLNEAKWVKKAQECLSGGLTLLIENTPEDIDATLDPVLSRSFKKSGGSNVIRCGDEVDYDEKNFRLILQCKLSNPHYKPEIAAQCTLINFIVTEEGLQDQLLASVVNREKPELEKKRADLVKSINEYLIQLSGLEDDLLKSLSNAAGTDILKDDKLVVQLEKTKAAAIEVERKVEMAKKTGDTN